MPLGNAPLPARSRADKIVELDWWQIAPARRARDHARPRAPLVDARAVEPQRRRCGAASSYRGPEGVAYHAGDTACFEGFAEIGARLGPIDWAMLPIGAYEPRWFMEPQHMNPEEAGAGVRRPRRAHAASRCTGARSGSPTSRSASRRRRMRAYFAEHGLADDRLWILDVGETRALTRP